MGVRTITTHVSDIDGKDIPADKLYALTIVKPDGSTQMLDISERDYRRLKLDGYGRTVKKRGRKPRAGSARPATTSRRTGRSARATGTRRGRGTTARRSSSSAGYDPKAVREWARSQGLEVRARGRVPSQLVEQWKAATAK